MGTKHMLVYWKLMITDSTEQFSTDKPLIVCLSRKNLKPILIKLRQIYNQ